MKFKLIEETTTQVPWNKGLKKERPSWQTCVDDDGKLYQRYLNKKINAAKEGIPCLLSFEEFCSLVSEAGLVSSMLGFSGGQKYVLARYNDQGAYEYGNCRFVTQLENAKERKVTDKSREASRQNAAKMNASRPDDIGDRIKRGMQDSQYYKDKRAEAARKKAEFDAKKDKRYSGPHNSQTGTYWITDGTSNQKWSDAKGEIPQGFYKGRVIK